MTATLGAVGNGFDAGGGKLARRDSEALAEAGEWRTDEHVPVQRIRRRLAAFDSLVNEEGNIRLPLHEPDSLELTGEYVVYSTTESFPKYEYYDTEKDECVGISPKSVGKTAIAWQLRFWSPQHGELTPVATDGGEDVPPTVIDPTSELDSASFFDDLLDFVEAQREYDRKDVREAYGYLNEYDFHSEYGGVRDASPASFTESESGAIVSFDVTESIDGSVPSVTGIYPGNEILLDVSDFGRLRVPEEYREGLPVEAEVDSVEGRRITATLIADRSPAGAIKALSQAFSADRVRLRAAPLFNPVPYDRETVAVKQVRDTPAKREVLAGSNPVEFDPLREVDAEFTGLNEYQTEAAKRALAAADIALIHGPPGTGKTRTLVAVIHELVKQGNRVLACAHSNQATDNLIAGGSTLGVPEKGSLHRAAIMHNFKIARVGSHTTHPVVREDYLDNSPRNADVVASTMSAAHQFKQDEFDVAVIDEASQASAPATLIPFNAAEKVVLAGDHKQLPPYASTELEEREMAVSLYEHLIDRYGKATATMLQRQYRMNEQIAAFPNGEFYSGRLETANENRDWTLADLPPVAAHDVPATEEQTPGRSYRNPREAEVAGKEVDRLVDAGVDPADIGVITPYNGQIDAINAAISDTDGHGNVKVDTVDSFQGGERDAIVVSFVRANSKGSAGFLTLPDEGRRRLNVAMTRAKKRLVLVGNWDTLAADETTDNCSDTYQRLREWLVKNDCFAPVQTP